MKKIFSIAMLCLAVAVGVSMVSCGKEKVEPIVNDTTTDTLPGENPDPVYSIIGQWELLSAIQDVTGNPVDITPFYGEHFYLTFMEDGTLLTSDGTNEVPMQWTLEGDQLAFISAPGAAPVMYTVVELTENSLVIENGTGTGYVTTMTLKRI
ncbi:MAG: hypothetical protein MJZ86_09310 [Bacteroidales bacterium]|nr:hypothetical protein [Bacteroidales bacterium]